MTLREVLANRARRKMRLARESRESEIRPSRRRRLMESLEARRQNHFIESREAARVRNHYILVEDENEDDLVEIEPDTSVATAEEQPVEKDDVVKTLQDLAAQLGYDITPKAEAPAPVETPASEEAPETDAPETDAPVTEEGQKCDDCQECKVTTEADEDNTEKSEDASAEDDKADGDAPEGEEVAGEDEPSDEDEKAEDDKEEEPVEIAPEDMPQDVEEVADLLSTIPNSTWNEIVGKILSGKEE